MYPAVQHPTDKEVYRNATATEDEIQKLVNATSESMDEEGDLVFSNIYTVKRKNSAGGQYGDFGCALVWNENWPPGQYKNVHFIRGGISLLSSNYLRGACDPAKYDQSSDFTMKSGIRIENDERKSKDQPSDSSELSEEKSSDLRERVTPSDNDVAHAQDVIKERLKDPESARFRRVYGAKNENDKIAICGEFNAKNSYGGYVGYKPFMVFGDDDRGYVWDANEDGYSFDNMMIEEICPTE